MIPLQVEAFTGSYGILLRSGFVAVRWAAYLAGEGTRAITPTQPKTFCKSGKILEKINQKLFETLQN